MDLTEMWRKVVVVWPSYRTITACLHQTSVWT